jgi:hypothetical protein
MPTITPLNGPALPNTNATPTQESPRQRAINAFKEAGGEVPPPQREAVRNPSQVSVEELSAIRPPQQKVSSDNSEAAPENDASTEVTKRPEEPLSTQYAILARKEKALRAKQQAQEQAIRQREAQIAAREEAIKLQAEQQRAEYESKYIPRDRITKDPLNVLAELGLSSDQITQLALNAPSQQDIAYKTEIESLKAEIRALRDETNGVKKNFEDQNTQSYQQALNQIEREARDLVKNDPYFESIRATGQVREVRDLIEKTFKEDGYVMDVEQAAKLVEDELSERFYRYSNKISKVRNRFGSKSEPVAKEAATQASQPKPQSKTLTNAQSSTRSLTAKERAVLAFRGELKS